MSRRSLHALPSSGSPTKPSGETPCDAVGTTPSQETATTTRKSTPTTRLLPTLTGWFGRGMLPGLGQSPDGAVIGIWMTGLVQTPGSGDLFPSSTHVAFLTLRSAPIVKIWVVDNGGQWTHREWRVLRYLKQETEMVDNKTPLDDLQAAELDGLLLSGGAPRVGVDGELGSCGDYIDGLDIPMLGICAGHQYMARHFGGDAAPGDPPEFGAVEMEVLDEDDILRGVPERSTIWASHHDEVSVVPDSFQVLAKSETCPVQVMRHNERPLFGMQFHPEVEHTEAGVTMFENFIRICSEHQRS